MERIYEVIEKKYLTTLYKNYNELEDEKKSESKNDFWSDPVYLPKRYFLFRGFERLQTSHDEESFIENYGNPFATVEMSRKMITVQKNGDKISIKKYWYNKTRIVNHKFFRKKTRVDFITYNVRTNALYFGHVQDYHKKRKSRKTINRVTLTRDWIDIILGEFLLTFEKNEDRVYRDVIENFVNSIPGTEKYHLTPKFRFYKHFLENSGAKLSNNWESFLFTYPQPTKKFLKNHKFKFVDTYMAINSLTGDKIKRCLHKAKEINVTSLKMVFDVFGEKYILSKHDSDIVKIIESNISNGPLICKFDKNDFTKSEINNIYSIFTLVLDSSIDTWSFNDHLTFKRKLSVVEPVKWKSTNMNEFMTEHFAWSEKVSELNDCKYVREYNHDFTQWVKQIIPINEVDYYPVLLTDTVGYNFESKTQNNCVRTYINKPESVILSLRKNNSNSTEKLTIEYGISVDEDVLKLTRVQTKYKSNQSPNSEWGEALSILDERISHLCSQKLFTLPEIEVTFPNKKIIKSQLKISEEGFLNWDNNKIFEFQVSNNYDYGPEPEIDDWIELDELPI